MNFCDDSVTESLEAFLNQDILEKQSGICWAVSSEILEEIPECILKAIPEKVFRMNNWKKITERIRELFQKESKLPKQSQEIFFKKFDDFLKIPGKILNKFLKKYLEDFVIPCAIPEVKWSLIRREITKSVLGIFLFLEEIS